MHSALLGMNEWLTRTFAQNSPPPPLKEKKNHKTILLFQGVLLDVQVHSLTATEIHFEYRVHSIEHPAYNSIRIWLSIHANQQCPTNLVKSARNIHLDTAYYPSIF